MSKTYYEVLGVKRNASADEIKAAYKKQASAFHPDKYPDRPKFAEDIMKEVNSAYAVLRDPVKKAHYDEWLSSQEPEQSHSDVSDGGNGNEGKRGKFRQFYSRNKKAFYAGAVALIVAVFYINNHIQSLPKTATGINGYQLGQKLADVKFRHEIKASPQYDTSTDSVFATADLEFWLWFKRSDETLNMIGYHCSPTSSKYIKDFNGVGCNDHSEDLVKRYGESNIHIYCSSAPGESNLRTYHIPDKHIWYYLDSNNIELVVVSKNASPVGKWGACNNSVLPLSTDAKPLASLADDEFNQRFICPEDLATEPDREKALRNFVDWYMATHKQATVEALVGYRMDLLRARGCKKTLENIGQTASETFSQQDADYFMIQFKKIREESGMTGVATDIAQCYTNAYTALNMQQIRGCYLYDLIAVMTDNAWREMFKEKTGKDPGEVTPYFSKKEVAARKANVARVAFPNFTSQQIDSYYSRVRVAF